MQEKFYDPDKCMGFMTFTTSRMLAASLHKHMAALGLDLTAEQWGLLMRFWNRGDITQEEITRIAGVDKSTVSRALKGMERKGWIIRKLDPADTRRKILSLTDKADALKQSSLRAVQITLAQALKGIDMEECAVCLKVLGLIKTNLLDAAE
ncbi:MAG: MarR family transcriptional regulator [Deltaproteobacteria bacterium]|jgi:DNA-binding MarR family transcriptional regulator|nr:MarR family transcriptional regulator [Deltaproteobacteria bacterium]